MEMGPRKQTRDFVLWFLLTVTVVSIGLNILLIARARGTDLWENLRVALLRAPTVTAEDHARGPSQAQVVVIDYSDYQCPYSAEMYASLKKMADESKIKWVYRNYPLTAVHPLALKEAEAAECAGEQGKFWQYSDALVDARLNSQQAGMADAALRAVGLPVGVNPEALEQCLSSDRIAKRLQAQIAEGSAERIRATPTIFVNGKRETGALSYETLVKLIDNK